MVRMQATSNQQQSQQQFMRMQQQQQQQNSQQQNRPMMHGTALRQILQHPGGGAGGPGQSLHYLFNSMPIIYQHIRIQIFL